jgi:hypothetical protein
MRKFVIVVFTIALLVVFVLPTTAHEHREVGDYELTFGWQAEPAVAGVLNGPELFIAPAGESHEDESEEHEHEEESVSLEELNVSLEVEVIFGPASRTFSLEPAFGEPGHFVADMIPTRPGDYTFRVTGTIGDLEIDETFDSAEGGFSSVEPASDIQFPEPDPTASELMAHIEALEARIAALEAQ